MKMICFVGATVSLLLSPCAPAAKISGGGGKGVVCRDPHGAIRSVELLDLWEAKHIYTRDPLASGADARRELDDALGRIENMPGPPNYSDPGDGEYSSGPAVFKAALRITAAEVAGLDGTKDTANVIFRRRVKLKLTDDSLEDMTPDEPGCHVEQIVSWKDYPAHPVALVNLDLLERMDQTNRAALGLHEALYWFLRVHSEERNSLRVRRVVGFVMSGGRFPPRETPAKPYVECVSDAHVDLSDDLAPEDGGSRLLFVQRGDAVEGIVDHVRNVFAIDIAQPNGYKTIEDMDHDINYNGVPFTMRLVETSDRHLETETAVYLKINKGGRATVTLATAAGGQEALPDRDLRCTTVR